MTPELAMTLIRWAVSGFLRDFTPVLPIGVETALINVVDVIDKEKR